MPVAQPHPLTLPEQLRPLLRAARKEAGLSQTQVAGLLGLSQSRYSELEANPSSFTLEQLLKTLRILQLELAVQPRHAQRPALPPSDW